jgi:[protein-PII] uridylyltransferase
MLSDLRSTEEHADSRLGPDAGAGPGERLQAFKRFLKLETERLRMRHRRGLGGLEVARRRAYLVDLVVRRVVELAAAEAGRGHDLARGRLAVLGVGGYGRAELAPHSDVDLLFLHENGSGEELAPLVESSVRQLWDSGLSVGHAFRSLGEAVAMVRDDLHSRNAVAEARVVAGGGALHEQLEAQLARAIYSNKRTTARYLDAVREEWRERHARFGEVVCLLEPNVKESAGGLRDLHTVLWVGRALHGCRGLKELVAADLLSRVEYRAARRAFGFLCRVRNEAHFSAGRLRDLLDLELQQLIASNLGYTDRRGHLASELLMRDYYRRASELAEISADTLERFWGGGGLRLPLPAKRIGSRAGLTLRSGRLQAPEASRQPALSDAEWITDVYETAQTTGAPLSSELRRGLRVRVKGIGRRFRESPDAAGAFLRVLRRPGRVASTLRLMHGTGFLGRFIPEFGRVTFLVQHDHYHCYTIDEHTLEAIEALDRVADPGRGLPGPFAKAFAELADPASLYLGLLLHDIGKGRGGGHVGKGVVIARRVCRRLGVEGRLAEDVELLVEKHLLMSRISQRRDLAEEQPVTELIEAVGDVDRLNRLLLLTYADINGVGPGVWNTWKATLLLDLYHKAHARLTGRDESPSLQEAGLAVKERALRELPPVFRASEIERHYALLPDRYRRLIDFDALQRDLRLVTAQGSAPLVAEWRSSPEGRPDELTVCTRDAPGRLALLAGTLTAHGLDILGVDVYTRDDDIVLDTFTLSRVGEFGRIDAERRRAVEEKLLAAVEGRYDVEAAVARRRPGFRRRRPRLGGPSVRFDGEASPHSTVIEVRADDEPGLVYRIARTLAACGCEISFAKLATEKNHALDVFYVRDSTGSRLDSEHMQSVAGALSEALGSSR